MDQENANLRNQLFDNSETILLLQATLQASDIECQNNVKTAIEQKDSEILFKVKWLQNIILLSPPLNCKMSVPFTKWIGQATGVVAAGLSEVGERTHGFEKGAQHSGSCTR